MTGRARFGKMVGVLALTLAPVPVLAQAELEPGAPEVRREAGPPSGYGAAVQLGGGVMNFSGSTARSLTDVGGSWDLRLAWGTRTLVGVEAAYIGTANSLNVSGIGGDAALLGSGAEGVLRLNAPMEYRGSLFAPFAFGGLGWTRFDVINEDFNNSIVASEDDVMTFPVGGGVAFGYRGLFVDARFTYRFVTREDLIGNTDLDNWIVGANIGAEF